ncbi:putative filamentation protein [Diplodia seriata]|uniref:Putative filamentation protein n=1 Tax=Diplodia seriata TaxID=420778 RepID=A0A0G2GA39_9PEZI|nr:putative filamentation protein [Diplodia seriata]
MPAENAKALNYIGQLDEARCNGRWDALPELARKIEKHASHRTCIYTTARAEAQVAAHIRQQRNDSLPPTPTTPPPDLPSLIDSLAAAKDQETTHKQDVFAAETCLAWIHWVLDQPSESLARLPSNVAETIDNLRHGDESFTGWTQVCIVKAAYLKGSVQEKNGAIDEALKTYESVLHFVGSDILSAASLQFKAWSEALLARLCVLLDISKAGDRPEDLGSALHAFRLWARLMENGKAQFSGEALADPPDMRRAVWKAYYDTLSIILRRGSLYSGSSDPDHALLGDAAEHASEEQYLSARLQQRAELKLAESVYESLLLKEARFPKASESNEEVDAWAESVMGNWRIICGPAWTDEELGEGGKAAVGKGVLDILYRAATKSYHSTRILRHLFIVHSSLAEFDLAFKAFDSYVEIVSRGKDRAEKSGEEDPGLDDDNTVLRTAAEAVRILCRFGTRRHAEKAKEVGEQIEKWLKQQTPASRPGTATSEAPHANKSTERLLSPRVLAIAHRAVGISRAHWARLTYEATARSTFQAQAVQAFRKALHPEYQDTTNLETLYALGLLLAEMRDINGAIKVVKRALSSNPRGDGLRSPDGVVGNAEGEDANYVHERKLIPLWHLLALLLTAKSDFNTAAKTCDAAFDQFDDATVLFGNQGEAYRSEHLNESSAELEKSRGNADKGLVDRMESFEKEGILQVKVTQLLLLEVVEGTTAAVDASMELLGLYKRLYGDPTGDIKPPETVDISVQNTPGNRAMLQERRHTTSLLIDVWLFIAGLYARAALFEDAKGAVDEAFKLADNLESEMSQDQSSAKAFFERGWGGGKSIEELWADIWAARGEIAAAEAEPHEALGHFEKGLSHNPDHPAAVVGLSTILLDIYGQVIPAESAQRASAKEGRSAKDSKSNAPDPEELNRLAARDRAYSLLSSLTKLGTGWDYSEAWFALARAYEEGGQVQKAKDVLWWKIYSYHATIHTAPRGVKGLRCPLTLRSPGYAHLGPLLLGPNNNADNDDIPTTSRPSTTHPRFPACLRCIRAGEADCCIVQRRATPEERAAFSPLVKTPMEENRLFMTVIMLPTDRDVANPALFAEKMRRRDELLREVQMKEERAALAPRRIVTDYNQFSAEELKKIRKGQKKDSYLLGGKIENREKVLKPTESWGEKWVGRREEEEREFVRQTREKADEILAAVEAGGIWA